MKKRYRILFIVGIIWVGITIYFYFQHRVTIRCNKINETINVGDYTIVVDSVVIRNYERVNPIDNFFYQIAPELPRFLYKPIGYICSFYSKPYEFNNEYQYTLVTTHFVFDQPLDESQYDEVSKVLDERIDIDLIDCIGVIYSSGGGLQYDSEDNKIPHWIRGRMFPIERIEKPLIVRITDHTSNITKELTINPDNFKKETYGFLEKVPYRNY